MPTLRKVVLYVMDFENQSDSDVLYHLSNQKYLSVKIGEVNKVDINDWSDDHELNKTGVDHEKYFK